MSLLDVLPHRRRHVAGPIEVPAVPDLLWVEMYAKATTAHRTEHLAMFTACHRALWPFWLLGRAKARLLDATYCQTCWPGRRCEVCGLPSGGSELCRLCHTHSIDIDAQFARAA